MTSRIMRLMRVLDVLKVSQSGHKSVSSELTQLSGDVTKLEPLKLLVTDVRPGAVRCPAFAFSSLHPLPHMSGLGSPKDWLGWKRSGCKSSDMLQVTHGKASRVEICWIICVTKSCWLKDGELRCSQPNIGWPEVKLV